MAEPLWCYRHRQWECSAPRNYEKHLSERKCICKGGDHHDAIPDEDEEDE